MKNADLKKPPKSSSHHIVSWKHPLARAARDILKEVGIDIDAAVNGVYMPSYLKDLPHPSFPESYAHSKVHTESYYLNITNLLADEYDAGGGKEEIESILRYIGQELTKGSFPIDKTMER